VSELPPRPKRPRWGVRAMLWLSLAFVCVISSNMLASSGNDDWVLVTFLGTIAGFAGAAYCSVRGIASSDGWLPR
jgi:hypothetical protein